MAAEENSRGVLEVQVPGTGTVRLAAAALVVAGYTGRDPQLVRRHVEELARMGVPQPATVPEFYTLPPGLVTTAEEIVVDGECTSGEVEAVLLLTADGPLVTVGSDHTDRDLERRSVVAGKRACPKVVGRLALPYEDLVPRWDELLLRSWVDGHRLYQADRLGALLPPERVMELAGKRLGPLPPGTVLFLGTVPLRGAPSYSSSFLGELVSPQGEVLASCRYRARQRVPSTRRRQGGEDADG